MYGPFLKEGPENAYQVITGIMGTMGDRISIESPAGDRG